MAPLQGHLGRELDGEAVWIQGGSNLTHTLRAILIGMVTTPADQWVPLTRVGTHCVDAAESRAAGLQQGCAFVDVCKMDRVLESLPHPSYACLTSSGPSV